MFAPSRDWFAREATAVAPDLLGAVFSWTTPQGTVAIRLTEVEAYDGVITHTVSYGRGGNRLVLQDDGNLVIRNSAGVFRQRRSELVL